MEVVNELITTVSFFSSQPCFFINIEIIFLKIKLVKFYGWENQWIDRVMEARNNELKWLVRCASEFPNSTHAC